jgi:signal transduction histidine kinase
LQAQEDERKRISRELHDEIAQTLVGINVRLSELSRDAEVNPRGLQKRIARAQRLVEKSVATVHRFARELRPSVLDDLGLVPALHTFMKGIREQTGMRVSLSAFGAVEKINGDKRTVLYRVAQEALNNAARHAQASQAEVRIEKLGGAICVTIKDDGKGFQLEQVLRANKNRRLGLLGMRERLQMVGGNVAIDSTPGEGTTILAQIPLADGRPRMDSLGRPAGKTKLLNEKKR